MLQLCFDTVVEKTCCVSQLRVALLRSKMVVSVALTDENENETLEISDEELKDCVIESYTEEEIKSENWELSR